MPDEQERSDLKRRWLLMVCVINNQSKAEDYMAKRRKYAVRRGAGAMCNICGLNCGKGGALKKHVEGAHKLEYDHYKECFYGRVATVISDTWDDSVKTSAGKTVITHVLVRRFVGDPGPRGAAWKKP